MSARPSPMPRLGRAAGRRREAVVFFAGWRARLFVVPRGDAPRRRLA
ncbi:hypothetical protein [Micromonospora cathayae]|uniref:Uncharacterized protein n=1 Tax=Micromonospora cathayae TaxID=3028804 RepID=A0ABY7ZX99_9ACTN|nr:hypothetical protein [Micromonospora sp. HUAS 3]WDZ87540.1 hypothetical protein PVK37_14575 [Micromonospora sp. HUAS 3]